MHRTAQEVTVEELPETPNLDDFEIVRWDARAHCIVIVVRERAEVRKLIE